jgi:acetyl-CoA carboxylase carboxyltransferase component
LRAEYRQDVDIERLASELVIDAIVEPARLRDEIGERLAYARGRRDARPVKIRSVPPR